MNGDSKPRRLTRSNRNKMIAGVCGGLAEYLNMIVIAEGVETWDELVFLAKHGCDQMQGFLFSEPVAAPQIEARLEMSLAGLPVPAPLFDSPA